MVGICARYVLPRLTHFSMGQAQLRPYRVRVTGGARGRVLEIGIGSGRNLPFYGDAVEEIVGVDPSTELLVYAERAAAASKRKVTLLPRSAESLALENRSIDTVVMTWSLCSIPDPGAALREAKRVLKPEGQLRFVEHGLSPDRGVQRWQERLTPLWSYCSGGCHLNRKSDDLIRDAGFRIAELATGYARGPRFAAYMYEGSANP
jgi:ubiquinone/menaquinone biosynthesis C-methylase UbiE